jgi:hypothetical protein
MIQNKKLQIIFRLKNICLFLLYDSDDSMKKNLLED